MAQTARVFETIVREGSDADDRLRELGLTRDELVRIVQQGEYARTEATANDPQNAAGWDAYRYRVRAFRDTYVPQGWKVGRNRGLELTISPDGVRAVITRGGDSGVGLRDGYPQPAGRVGDMTCETVGVNASRLLDPNWMNAQPMNDGEHDDDAALPGETWMLLVVRDIDVVRSELSLAREVQETEAGLRVLAWEERIILPGLDMSASPVGQGGPEEPIAPEPTIVRKR